MLISQPTNQHQLSGLGFKGFALALSIWPHLKITGL